VREIEALTEPSIVRLAFGGFSVCPRTRSHARNRWLERFSWRCDSLQRHLDWPECEFDGLQHADDDTRDQYKRNDDDSNFIPYSSKRDCNVRSHVNFSSDCNLCRYKHVGRDNNFNFGRYHYYVRQLDEYYDNHVHQCDEYVDDLNRLSDDNPWF